MLDCHAEPLKTYVGNDIPSLSQRNAHLLQHDQIRQHSPACALLVDGPSPHRRASMFKCSSRCLSRIQLSDSCYTVSKTTGQQQNSAVRSEFSNGAHVRRYSQAPTAPTAPTTPLSASCRRRGVRAMLHRFQCSAPRASAALHNACHVR